MPNPATLENYYKRYVKNLNKWLPDGMIDVDIHVLQHLDLLHYHHNTYAQSDSTLTRYFQVSESDGRLTLCNDQFVIWITPDRVDNVAITHTLIALNKDEDIHLELGFTTTGIYNHSHLVLRILEKFLMEIQETENVLAKIHQ